MGAHRAYLDHAATTPLRPAVREAMVRALDIIGNPSSVHAEGRTARAAVETARQQVARLVGGEARNVTFTSGATEALNTLLRNAPAVENRRSGKAIDRVLTSPTEHSAVLGALGARAVSVKVDGDGVLDLDAWREMLATEAFGMVTLQLVNSETGVVQPVAEAAAIARDAGAVVVCDAVAACGKIALDLGALGVDALVISAHKFGGPKGVGAFILQGEALRLSAPLLWGGGQESRRRSGTENVHSIIGLGEASKAAPEQAVIETQQASILTGRLIDGLRAARPDLVVLSETAIRVPQIFSVLVPGLKAETALIALDLAGVAVSSGAACSSGKVQRSHVLTAMGIDPDRAGCALRFSLGWNSTAADVDHAVSAFVQAASAPSQSAARRRHDAAA